MLFDFANYPNFLRVYHFLPQSRAKIPCQVSPSLPLASRTGNWFISLSLAFFLLFIFFSSLSPITMLFSLYPGRRWRHAPQMVNATWCLRHFAWFFFVSPIFSPSFICHGLVAFLLAPSPFCSSQRDPLSVLASSLTPTTNSIVFFIAVEVLNLTFLPSVLKFNLYLLVTLQKSNIWCWNLWFYVIS